MSLTGFFHNDVPQLAVPKATPKVWDCSSCTIDTSLCRNPKIEPYGDFNKEVMMWGEGPGDIEDKNNRPFDPDANAGGYLHETCHSVGLDLYRDCIIVNAVDCRPVSGKANRKPTAREIRCCQHRKLQALEKYKPKVILLLGDSATKSFYGLREDLSMLSTEKLACLRGHVAPDQQLKAWIIHEYHPSYIVRGNRDHAHIFAEGIAKTAFYANMPRERFPQYGKPQWRFLGASDAYALLSELFDDKIPFTFDYETSSYRYHEGIHEIYMVSVKPVNSPTTSVLRLTGEIKELFKKLLEAEDIPKYCQNAKHEIQASWYVLGVQPQSVVFDTMLAAHILNDSAPTALKKQAYTQFGCVDYSKHITPYTKAAEGQKNRFAELDDDTAGAYCAEDSHWTDALQRKQRRALKAEGLDRAYDLFHRGMLAFSVMERNGIRVDVDAAHKMDKDIGERIEQLKEKILTSREARKFERVVGRPMNYKQQLSHDDLRKLLYEVLKLKALKTTKTTYSVDVDSLQHYAKELDIVRHELQVRKLDKIRGTYIAQFLRHQVNGYLYPTVNLHLARSYRSSYSEPNLQNTPKRLEEAAEIRRLIIPYTPNRKLAEVDYGSMEVRIIACASSDPALMEYMTEGHDPHGEWAEELFLIKQRELGSAEFNGLRYKAKNGFVFPEIYGSYYKTIAREIGCPKWFRTYQQWEDHVRQVEKKFWKKFSGVRRWQDSVVEQYKQTGYVQDGAWGFRRGGYLTRNKLYNFPIQGPAFHCLLWSIIQLWESGEIGNPKAALIGQIHDSMLFDVEPVLFDKLRKNVDYIMTEEIRERHPWITVPLETEWSVGDNWLEMEKVE